MVNSSCLCYTRCQLTRANASPVAGVRRTARGVPLASARGSESMSRYSRQLLKAAALGLTLEMGLGCGLTSTIAQSGSTATPRHIDNKTSFSAALLAYALTNSSEAVRVE
jgi:hypothetical protein